LSGCIYKPLKNDFCISEYPNNVNLCIFDDGPEKHFFFENCKQNPPTNFTEIKTYDYVTCKKESAKRYNKISPSYIVNTEKYPDYEKCNENICLICDYFCDVNSELLDWRFESLNRTYKKLANLIGSERLLSLPIKIIVYSEDLDAQKDLLLINNCIIPASASDFWTKEAKIYLPDGFNFKCLINSNLDNAEKILHADYPDYIYLSTFENETDPAHEMLHTVFKVRYGGFSYNSIEEHFAQPIGSIISGHNFHLDSKINDVGYYESFCDDVYKYGGYSKLYYLCKNYGFDVNSLPKLFNELDKIKEDNLNKNPEHKGKVSNEQFVDALSKAVGKDISIFWNSVSNT